MKKVFKKMKAGFTLVELVVVIAIIAILGTVSVVGYFAFIDKANLSNDTTVTTQINTALQADEVINGHPGSLTNASKVMEENGIIFEDLTAASKGYRYAYDSKNNRVILLDDKNEPTEPLKGSKKSDVFVVIDSPQEGATFSDYSWYLSSKYNNSSTINATNGVDVGNAAKTGAWIIYNDTVQEEVVFHTKGKKLEVINSNAVVSHYGASEQVRVTKVASTSYHEYGNVTILDFTEGHVVLENNSHVDRINILESNVSLESKIDLSDTAIVLKKGITKDNVILPADAENIYPDGVIPLGHLSSTDKEYTNAKELVVDLSTKGGFFTINKAYINGIVKQVSILGNVDVTDEENGTQNAISLKKDLIIDCNGIGLSINAFHGLYIDAPGINLTLKNGTITAASNSTIIEATPKSTGTINLENVTLEGQFRKGVVMIEGSTTLNIDKNSTVNCVQTDYEKSMAAVYFGGNSTINVHGSVFSKNAYTISGHGEPAEQNTTLNIYNGAKITSVVNSIATANGVAIYLPQCGTLNMSGGFVEGPTGIVVKSGSVNITGGTIRGLLTHAPFVYSYDGFNSTGDALVINFIKYPGGDPTSINVTNVTLETADPNSHPYVVYYQDDSAYNENLFTGNIEYYSESFTKPVK